MANDALIEHILSALEQASPTERVVLKMAAALVKQMDEDYEFAAETDQRIKMTKEEMDWIPDRFEVWYGIVRPKDWETPERLAAAKRYREAVQRIIDETGLPFYEASQEYERRRKK